MLQAGKNLLKYGAAGALMIMTYEGGKKVYHRYEERSLRSLSAEQLAKLGNKIVDDFKRQGYTQMQISKYHGHHIRDLYWSFRYFIEFGAEHLDMTETVWDRICCYHLEAPKKDGTPQPKTPSEGWHFWGGPVPVPDEEVSRNVAFVHRDCTRLGNQVMAAIAAATKDPTFAAIALDDNKRSEVIFKCYPEETPQRPANCGRHGLLYMLPGTTMMDSPLCPQTFEVYDPKRRQYINLEQSSPGIVFVTIIPGVPLLKYTKEFTPAAWRVVSQLELTHDSRKTVEYAYGTVCNVPPKFPQLSKEEEKRFSGPQDPEWSSREKKTN